MPMYPSFADAFARIISKHKIGGKFVAIGRNTPIMDISYEFLESLKSKYNLLMDIPKDIPLDKFVGSDKELFKLLGFTSVQSIDVTNLEGAEYIMDLNDKVSNELLFEHFDVIHNNGSLEHVFHIPNFLYNITKMLKVGGYVIHFSPINNFVDHGFYQISPTLFTDYYLENKFLIKECRIFRYEFGAHHKTLDINYLHIDGHQDYFSVEHEVNRLMGKFDGALYGVIFVAQKTDASTLDGIPMQSAYANETVKNSRLKTLKPL